MSTAVLVFAPTGTGSCLYTEMIELRSLGRLEITRATSLDFNNATQHWEVHNRRGRLLYFSRSRQDCLEWEHSNLP